MRLDDESLRLKLTRIKERKLSNRETLLLLPTETRHTRMH